MRVIGIAGQKGGTGKSSIGISLAVASEEQGLRSCLLDLDPQGTIARWRDRRAAVRPEAMRVDIGRIPVTLEALRRQGVDLVIIDTPGADAPTAAAAMHAADFCLVPARPSLADIEALRPTVRSLLTLDRDFAFVLNQCLAGRSIRTSDACRALMMTGTVAEVTLALRIDHVDALALGQGVTERDRNGKAAGEIRNLLNWVLARLENDRKAA